MDIRCENCDTLYHLNSAHAGYAFRCEICRAGMTVPAGASADLSGALYVVCAECGHGYTAGADAGADVDGGSGVCPACGASMDLDAFGATIAMGGASSLAEELAEAAPEQPALPEEAAPAPGGKLVGGYRLEAILARTALGTICRGEQVTLGRMVAVYLLAPQLASRPACAEAFLSEARRAAGLVHPNIARVYDVAQEPSPFVVSELVPGITLGEKIASGDELSLEEVMTLGAEVARGLAAAHARRAAHGGLNPASVFLTDEGEVRVQHFGIARALHQSPALVNPDCGEWLYLAPECLAGGAPDPRSDLYGLGAVLYGALTGSPPLEAEGLARCRKGRYPDPPPPLAQVASQVAPAVSTLVEGLLATLPEERPGSAAEIAVQLESLAEAPPAGSRPAVAPAIRQLGRAERRRYKRFRADMDVNVQEARLEEADRRQQIAKLHDVSENGAFIATQDPLEPGTFVDLAFTLEGTNTRVQVLGLVRWQDHTPGQVGMGVQFLEVSTGDRRHLNRMVDRQAATEAVQSLAGSAIHRHILKFLMGHWDEEASLEQMMHGTGASRALFERAMKDFEKAGLIERDGPVLYCARPRNEAVEDALEDLYYSSR